MSMRITDHPAVICGCDAVIVATLLSSYVMIVPDISVTITGLSMLSEPLHFSQAGLS